MTREDATRMEGKAMCVCGGGGWGQAPRPIRIGNDFAEKIEIVSFLIKMSQISKKIFIFRGLK